MCNEHAISWPVARSTMTHRDGYVIDNTKSLSYNIMFVVSLHVHSNACPFCSVTSVDATHLGASLSKQ